MSQLPYKQYATFGLKVQVPWETTALKSDPFCLMPWNYVLRTPNEWEVWNQYHSSSLLYKNIEQTLMPKINILWSSFFHSSLILSKFRNLISKKMFIRTNKVQVFSSMSLFVVQIGPSGRISGDNFSCCFIYPTKVHSKRGWIASSCNIGCRHLQYILEYRYLDKNILVSHNICTLNSGMYLEIRY